VPDMVVPAPLVANLLTSQMLPTYTQTATESLDLIGSFVTEPRNV